MTAAEYATDPYGWPIANPDVPEGRRIDCDDLYPWPAVAEHQMVVTYVACRPVEHGPWHYWTTGRVVMPRLPGMDRYMTVIDRPAGPMDAPAAIDDDREGVRELHFLTPFAGFVRAVDPERPSQGEPMFPGWPSSGPEAVWPPEFHHDDPRAPRPVAR